MNLSTNQSNDTLLVRVEAARLDAAIAIQFKDRMRDLVDQAPERVVLDMSQVTFLDSSGLGAVVSVMKLLAPDRRLELAGLTALVAKVFALTRMDEVFTIHAEPPAMGHAHAGSDAIAP